MSITEKIKIIENLPGCGHHIRAEARIAAESIRVAKATYEQELKNIEERFELEAWKLVKANWTEEELSAAK